MGSDPLRRRNSEISFPILSDGELKRFRRYLEETLALDENEVVTSFVVDFGTNSPPTADIVWRERDKMNVYPAAQRIGDEAKQTYRDHLIEAHVGGFLTQEEYDARMTWLDAAVTKQQANKVLEDLKDVRLLTTPVEGKVTRRWDKVTQMCLVTGTFGLLASIGGMTHQWIAVAVLMMLWTISIVWIAQ